MAYRSYLDDLHNDMPDYLAEATDPSKGPRPLAPPTTPKAGQIDYTYPGTAPTAPTPGAAAPAYTYPSDPALGRGAFRPQARQPMPMAPPTQAQPSWMNTPEGQALISGLMGDFKLSEAEARQRLNYPTMPDGRFYGAIRSSLGQGNAAIGGSLRDLMRSRGEYGREPYAGPPAPIGPVEPRTGPPMIQYPASEVVPGTGRMGPGIQDETAARMALGTERARRDAMQQRAAVGGDGLEGARIAAARAAGR